ncbi:MAG: energy-coupling factor ABC transporter substrate-binding protein [Bacilli bacterium]
MKKIKILLGVVAILLIIFIPYIFIKEEFFGTDDMGVNAIYEIDKEYKPHSESIFEINDEMETMFFTLQAVLGSLGLGYCLGKISNKQKSNVL